MEKILLRGLRFVFEDYNSTYEDLLQRANMVSVEIMREKTIITEMFKCLHSLGPKYMSEIFTISTRESRLGPSFKAPRCRTTRFGEHSLRSQGPRLWNHLPKETKMSKTIVELKGKLINYSGQPCKCTMCR
jgi:hypothetical protein